MNANLLGLGAFATLFSTSAMALADGAPCAASVAPGHPTALPVVALSIIAVGAVLTLVRKK